MAEKDDAPKRQSPREASRTAEKAEEQARSAVDRETEQGFRGDEQDSTPNEHYTVAGVLAGRPVPEAAADPAVARREASNL
jgi:hypothetical protein